MQDMGEFVMCGNNKWDEQLKPGRATLTEYQSDGERYSQILQGVPVAQGDLSVPKGKHTQEMAEIWK